MSRGLKPIVLEKEDGTYMICSCCSEAKPLTKKYFHQCNSQLKYKNRCKLCSKSYYKHNAEEFKRYRYDRYFTLKLHGVEKLSLIG